MIWGLDELMNVKRPVQILGAVFLGWPIPILLGSLRGRGTLMEARPVLSRTRDPAVSVIRWPWWQRPLPSSLVALWTQTSFIISSTMVVDPQAWPVDRGFYMHHTTWGRQGIHRGRPIELRSRLNWGSHLEQLQIHKAMNCYSLLTALIHGLAARRGPFWCSQLHYLELSLPWPLPHFLLLTLVHLAGQLGNSSRRDRLSILL